MGLITVPSISPTAVINYSMPREKSIAKPILIDFSTMRDENYVTY